MLRLAATCLVKNTFDECSWASFDLRHFVSKGMGRTNFATDAVGIVLKEVQQAKE